MSENINKLDKNKNNEYMSKNELYNEKGVMLIENEKMSDEENNKEERQELNLGKNIIYQNKIILGIKDHLYDMIFLMIIFFLIYIIFIIFIFPYFYYNKSFIIYLFILITITTAYMLGLYNQLCCFCTEPGIIPRNYHKYYTSNLCDKYILSKITKKPIIMIQRHCNICSIKRPKKCQHCFFCDNCVEEFDHHNQYVSNCIGKRNKKHFFLFLFFELFFLIEIYIFSFIQFYLVFIDYTSDIKNIYNYISMTVAIIGIILILMLLNLYYNYDYQNRLIYVLLCSNIFFVFSFYYSKYKNSSSLPLYVSPFNIFLITMPFKWMYYFFTQFIHQLNMIAFGMTSSEYKNLLNYIKIINKDQSYIKLPDNNNNDNSDDIEDGINNDSIKDYNMPCTVIKDVPSKKHIPKFNINDLIKNVQNLIMKEKSKSLIYQELNNH